MTVAQALISTFARNLLVYVKKNNPSNPRVWFCGLPVEKFTQHTIFQAQPIVSKTYNQLPLFFQDAKNLQLGVTPMIIAFLSCGRDYHFFLPPELSIPSPQLRSLTISFSLSLSLSSSPRSRPHPDEPSSPGSGETPRPFSLRLGMNPDRNFLAFFPFFLMVPAGEAPAVISTVEVPETWRKLEE